MPDDRRTTCRVCFRPASEVGAISWNGKCGECGERLNREALADLHYHRGPVFDHWRQRLAASVGGVLLDDLPRPE